LCIHIYHLEPTVFHRLLLHAHAAAAARTLCTFSNRCPNPLACNHNAADDSLVRLHPYYNTFMTLSETANQQFNESFWQVYTDKLCQAGYR
jgi:hypothetical protein